jgi:hypothetical protein
MNVRSIKRKDNPQQARMNNMDFPFDKDGLIYVRQSSLGQVRFRIHSFEMQTDKFVEYFRNMGCTGHIEIVADDEAMSGTLDIHERKGMTKTVEWIEQEKVGWIGAVHVNRLTRDPWLITPAVLMKKCYEHKVWLATLRMNYNFKDEYCQQAFMLEAQESARHLQWMKLVLGGGKSGASDKGLYDGRFLSPGYIVDRTNPLQKKYTIYVPHAEIVFWLFKRFFELDGNFPALKKEVADMPYLFPAFESWVDPKNIGKFLVKKIKDGLYKGNYKPSERGLRSILTNPVYIGWWLPLDGGVIEHNHPPIVDEELFTFAHSRLSTHDLNGERQKPALAKNGSVQALLKKSLEDGKGNPVYAKADRKCGYYVACTYESLTSEYEVSVAVAKLDEIFLEKFLARAQSIDPDKFSDWEDKIEQKQKIREQRMQRIQDQIDQAQSQWQESMDSLKDPDIPKTKQMKIDLANTCAGLEEKIAKLQNDLQTSAEDDTEDEEVIYEISTLIPRIVEFWKYLPFRTKIRFVNALVKKAVLKSVAPSWLELHIEWKMEGWQTDAAYIQASKGAGKEWTDEEEQILRELYPNAEAEALLHALPNRSWQGIYCHAHTLDIHRVSPNRSPRGMRLSDRMAVNDIAFMQAHRLSSDKKVHWFA